MLWNSTGSLPSVPSPLVYRGVLYTMKEGGILASYDPRTGAVLKRERLPNALGDYCASPIAADGKIYLVSEEGKATVVQAGANWQVLRTNDLEDGCKGTPAVAGGRLYIRTYGTLYCFGSSRPAEARTSLR
jgi:outer membrane protein assembly factor BamB